MKDDFGENVSAAKVPSMFWLAGTVTVEQKDAVNNAKIMPCLLRKFYLKGGLILKLILKKS